MRQGNVMLRSGHVRELLWLGFSLCVAGCKAQPRLLLPLELLVWCLQGGTIQLLLPQTVLLLIFEHSPPQWCISSGDLPPPSLGGEAASLRAVPRRNHHSPPAPPMSTEQLLLPGHAGWQQGHQQAQ